jgi:hypothetical protein
MVKSKKEGGVGSCTGRCKPREKERTLKMIILEVEVGLGLRSCVERV